MAIFTRKNKMNNNTLIKLAKRHEQIRKESSVVKDKQETIGGKPTRNVLYYNNGIRTNVTIVSGDVTSIETKD